MPKLNKTPKKKSERTLVEIISNLKLRRTIEEMVNCINNKSPFPTDILSRLDKQRFVNTDHIIPQKSPNISNESTESLVCHLIRERKILKNLRDIRSIERKGNRKGEAGGADIVVNDNIKVEVKGTSVKKDITTKSKFNADVYALVWVETEDWMKGKSDCVDIRVIYNPHGIEMELLKSNGETKMRLHKSFEDAKNNGLTEEYKFDMRLCNENFKPETEYFG